MKEHKQRSGQDALSQSAHEELGTSKWDVISQYSKFSADVRRKVII
ncbi:hypothetical protein [Acetivibrio clariflavus]|nr:hypothetical protein [Acetivibrio clariflavus]